MNNGCCAVLGHFPTRFAWGFDETDPGCVSFKMQLILALDGLCTKAGRFLVACDPGVGLYAAEAINILRARNPDVYLDCVLPYEEVAAKWPSDLRDRHFTSLEECSHVTCVHRTKAPSCQLDAYKYTIDASDYVFAVYDPESARGDAVDQAVAYAEQQRKVILLFHPDTFALSIHQGCGK